MKIKVKKLGREGREYSARLDGWCELVRFAYRHELGAWCFWVRGNRHPEKFIQKDFPLVFFLDACRAQKFIYFGGLLEDREEIEITEGHYHVGLPKPAPDGKSYIFRKKV